MIRVIIEKDRFAEAQQLARYLQARMAEVLWNGETIVEADHVVLKDNVCFICSHSFAETRGGVSAITEMARKLKANRLMIISNIESESFGVSTQMKGNLIKLNMAAGDSTEECLGEGYPNNYSLQMAVSLILDDDHVAVADEKSLELMALARRVAKTDVTVFVNGPTGTGKEVLAKYIHKLSSRAIGPFVAVNCAAIPENMLEAILFGHEKGAFTGASTANKGIFRAADTGTLLLDEISEMPLGLQAKLLRVLQEKKVTPLGGQREIDVDVRVVATTNRNMLKEVKEGRFREDLFYRLNVFPLSSRELHERKADIIAISSILLKRHAGTFDNIPALSHEAAEMLFSYGWPGNVRELENVLQRALVLCSDNLITAADIMVDTFFENNQATIAAAQTHNTQAMSL